jgi:hypothetical protein
MTWPKEINQYAAGIILGMSIGLIDASRKYSHCWNLFGTVLGVTLVRLGLGGATSVALGLRVQGRLDDVDDVELSALDLETGRLHLRQPRVDLWCCY